MADIISERGTSSVVEGRVMKNIVRATATLPPRLLIHGQEGVGKTTLATKFPAPVFLQTEDGIPAGIEADTFGLLSNFPDVRGALMALAPSRTNSRTVVIDALDTLEGLIWRDLCSSQGWASIESPVTARDMSPPTIGGAMFSTVLSICAANAAWRLC